MEGLDSVDSRSLSFGAYLRYQGLMANILKSLLSGLCKREDNANRSEISNYVRAFNVVYVKRKDPSLSRGGVIAYFVAKVACILAEVFL